MAKQVTKAAAKKPAKSPQKKIAKGKATKEVDLGSFADSYDSMKATVDLMAKDMEDFEQRGVGAAAGRLRKAGQELSKLGKLFRKQVQQQRIANKQNKG
jgi:hypothetical protein